MDPEPEPTGGRTELPTDFAEHAAAVTSLDAPPETLSAWWTAVVEQYAEDDLSVGLGDLYSETPTRHEVHVDGRVRYAHCAVDALEAAVMEEQDAVTVRSVDPVTATPVWVTVDGDGVEVSPEGALICFGSTIDPADVEAVGSLAAWSLQDDESEIRASVCRHTNAFESEATYEQWAAETDSVTAPLPPAGIVSLLREVPQECT